MIIGYVYDDGGRSESGFTGDTGDCAVRAIAILTTTAYSDVYVRMAACMKLAGYAASGNGYRQQPRRGLKPTISARRIQNLVKASYGLQHITLDRGPRPHAAAPALPRHASVFHIRRGGDARTGTNRAPPCARTVPSGAHP